LNNFLLKLTRPVGRGRLASAVFLSLYPVTAMAAHRASEPNAFYVVPLVLAIVGVPLWSIAVVGRLKDIGWSGWLALAYVLPWIAFISVISGMSVLTFFLSLGALITVQLPLMLLPGQTSAARVELAKQRHP